MNVLAVPDRLIELASRNIFAVVFVLTLSTWALLFLGSSSLHIFSVPFSGHLDLQRALANSALHKGGSDTVVQGISLAGSAGTSKEVGYALALNWSLFSAVLLPVIVAFSLTMRAEMRPTLTRLATAGMVRDTQFAKIDADIFVQRWAVDRQRLAFVPGSVGLLAIGFVVWNLWTTVASPLLFGFPHGLNIADATYEIDWSVACLVEDVNVPGGCAANLAFDVVAYTLIAVVAAAVAFSAFADAVLFMGFTTNRLQSRPAMASDGRTPLPVDWNIAASPADRDDKVCGFRAFSPFFRALLWNALVILTSLLLMIAQNTYLRDGSSANIFGFFQEDISATANIITNIHSPSDVLGVIPNLIVGSKHIDIFNVVVGVGVSVFLFVVITSFLASWLVLRVAGEDSRDLSLHNRSQLANELTISEIEAEERLHRMEFWPLGWPTFRGAVTIIVFMALSLISYRLLLVPIIAGVAMILARAIPSRAGGATPAVQRGRNPNGG